jgi:hypothetical protein
LQPGKIAPSRRSSQHVSSQKQIYLFEHASIEKIGELNDETEEGFEIDWGLRSDGCLLHPRVISEELRKRFGALFDLQIFSGYLSNL